LVAKGAFVPQSEDVMEARLMDMVVAVDQLKTSIPVYDFSLTEGAVDLWEFIILWWWLIGPFKSESKEPLQRYRRLLVFQLQQ